MVTNLVTDTTKTRGHPFSPYVLVMREWLPLSRLVPPPPLSERLDPPLVWTGSTVAIRRSACFCTVPSGPFVIAHFIEIETPWRMGTSLAALISGIVWVDKR